MSNEFKDWLNDYTEELQHLLSEFVETEECILCGTQRCDKSLEMAKGCPKWEQFVDDYYA